MAPVVRKKAETKTLPPKYLLLILTLLCMGMMLYTFTQDSAGHFMQDVAGFVVVPFQEGITKVGTALVKNAEKRKTIEDLLAENDRLQAEIDALNRENAQLMQDHYELSSLRSLYELDSTYADYDKVGARIIAADSGNRYSTFTINKGRDDGISENMNVIAGSGLVGIVSECGKNWSRVTTIISDGSNVSATVLHSRDHLIVSGDMELIRQGMIRYSQLSDRDREVKVGDKVVTSDISDRYLPGILIGYISSIDTDSNQLTMSGQLQPVVDFEHLTDVLIITQTRKELEGWKE
ncbi:MAG: rod shape-determining protein MreC [Lachnospiraceae bacterium]|nr:rod shape-determining protein MreC [Lachnospiraceae bacterium]